MKIMTKEKFKDLEFHDLLLMLKPNTDKKIPFVITNGGTDCVAKEDLHTVKTNLNVTEKENEISFVMLPDTIDLEIDYLGDGEVINEETRKKDFLIQYLNRLRVISYLPEEILKCVKDKRMLALGYAEKETEKLILDYCQSKYRKAADLLEKCAEASVKAEKGLTIHKQFKKHLYIHSLPFLFDGVEITNAEIENGEIYLTLDDCHKIVFSGAEILEEEIDIVNSYVDGIELYKKESFYELHLLIGKRDENLIENHYYITYKFKDLKFRN